MEITNLSLCFFKQLLLIVKCVLQRRSRSPVNASPQFNSCASCPIVCWRWLYCKIQISPLFDSSIQAAMESLVSGAICGITYHLFAGQPLTIIGSTGPVLVFESIVFKFCKWVNYWLSGVEECWVFHKRFWCVEYRPPNECVRVVLAEIMYTASHLPLRNLNKTSLLE